MGIARDTAYIMMASIWAKRSKCQRRQVGALIVKDKSIISDGYNGQPSGIDEPCETDGVTNWTVLHAEANAILKCAKEGKSCKGATLYLTLSPCTECSKLILQAGIERVVYQDRYRDTRGLRFLVDNGVKVEQYEA